MSSDRAGMVSGSIIDHVHDLLAQSQRMSNLDQSSSPSKLPVGRLAPSPTGALHIGNIRTFLWAWLSIRSRGGRVILRVEDLERPALPGVTEAMLSDLEWLGFDWDEGPVLIEGEAIEHKGPHAPYIQGLRRNLYKQVFNRMTAEGLIYPCTCTRADFAASAPHDGHNEVRYPGICRGRYSSAEQAHAESGRAPVWRLVVPEREVSYADKFYGRQEFSPHREVGDFVVFRKPDQPSYQLAVVIDDIAMGVSEVVRGDDLLSSAARQILIIEMLGGKIPTYGHVPLIVGPDGKRIAKRHGDSRIGFYRELGVLPGNIVGTLARWSGMSVVGPCKPAELIASFNWRTLNRDKVILTAERHRELSR